MNSILFLTILSLKQFLFIEFGPHVCGNSRCANVKSQSLVVYVVLAL
jgi:hypothetical protein